MVITRTGCFVAAEGRFLFSSNEADGLGKNPRGITAKGSARVWNCLSEYTTKSRFIISLLSSLDIRPRPCQLIRSAVS